MEATSKSNNRLAKYFMSFSASASIVVFLVGWFVLIGWMLDIPALVKVFPVTIPMKANTAIAFILLGTSLWLSLSKKRKLYSITAKSCAFIVALLGFLTLCEYLFNWNLGIDQMFIRETGFGVFPGRMAPNTAFNFLLLGLALLFIDYETKLNRCPSQYLSLGAAFIGMLALLGYAYGVHLFYGIADYVQMALHTALAFVLLTCGIIAARPNCGMMSVVTSDSLGGMIMRRLLPSAVTIVFVIGWLISNGGESGVFDIHLAVAIFALLIILVFSALILMASNSLHRADNERKWLIVEAEEQARIAEDRAEELDVQGEELAAANEELTVQGEELAASNEELQVTNEELSILNTELQEANDSLQLINEISADFLSGASLEHSLETMLATAKRLVSAGATSIAIYENPDIMKAWSYDLGGEQCKVQSPLGIGDHFPQLAAKYSRGVVINNDINDMISPPGHITLRNIMSLRVEIKNGWAQLIFANKEGGFTEEDARKVDVLARMVSIIVDRDMLDKSEREARAEAERHNAQLESFIASIADGVTMLDTDGNSVFMNDAGKQILGIPQGESFGDAIEYTRYSLDGDPIISKQTASYRALQGETVKDVRYKIINPWGKESVVDVSASPIRDAQGRIIGATNVFRDISERVEFEQHKQELYEREHHIADILQQALIPTNIPDQILGCKFSACYAPALREAEIGGDFYDVFELDDDKIGILIGDVAGKGLFAAIRVAAARYAIRSYAYLDSSPALVLSLANDALCIGEGEATHMLTAFFAVLDVHKGLITYSSGGHEPPFVRDINGKLEELDGAGGCALGMLAGYTFTEATRKMNAGDVVVMLTDGITEARTTGPVFFDKEGVAEFLTENPDASPDEVAAGLLEAAKAHAGGDLQDDAAIIVFEIGSEFSVS